MTIDYSLACWEWEQGGETWGFDPRMKKLSNEFEQNAVDALSETEIANIVTLHAWKCIRKQRNNLLIECDWTQGADVPDTIKTAWVSYRQALRDVTKQSDPDNITWPTKPS
tara:strand:- start:73 stop:405 length:333 start_codon:yes stop_codon:yes gene_type:complete